MLPSKGYFKSLRCPFHHEGICKRSYCHFRHSRKDGQSLTELPIFTNGTSKPPLSTDSNIGTDQAETNLQKSAINMGKPTEEQRFSENKLPSSSTDVVTEKPPTIVPSYKPTPISELRKRHIPVTLIPDSERVRSNSHIRKKPKIEYVPKSISGIVPLANYKPTQPTSSIESKSFNVDTSTPSSSMSEELSSSQVEKINLIIKSPNLRPLEIPIENKLSSPTSSISSSDSSSIDDLTSSQELSMELVVKNPHMTPAELGLTSKQDMLDEYIAQEIDLLGEILAADGVDRVYETLAADYNAKYEQSDEGSQGSKDDEMIDNDEIIPSDVQKDLKSDSEEEERIPGPNKTDSNSNFKENVQVSEKSCTKSDEKRHSSSKSKSTTKTDDNRHIRKHVQMTTINMFETLSKSSKHVDSSKHKTDKHSTSHKKSHTSSDHKKLDDDRKHDKVGDKKKESDHDSKHKTSSSRSSEQSHGSSSSKHKSSSKSSDGSHSSSHRHRSTSKSSDKSHSSSNKRAHESSSHKDEKSHKHSRKEEPSKDEHSDKISKKGESSKDEKFVKHAKKEVSSKDETLVKHSKKEDSNKDDKSVKHSKKEVSSNKTVEQPKQHESSKHSKGDSSKENKYDKYSKKDDSRKEEKSDRDSKKHKSSKDDKTDREASRKSSHREHSHSRDKSSEKKSHSDSKKHDSHKKDEKSRKHSHSDRSNNNEKLTENREKEKNDKKRRHSSDHHSSSRHSKKSKHDEKPRDKTRTSKPQLEEDIVYSDHSSDVEEIVKPVITINLDSSDESDDSSESSMEHSPPRDHEPEDHESDSEPSDQEEAAQLPTEAKHRDPLVDLPTVKSKVRTAHNSNNGRPAQPLPKPPPRKLMAPAEALLNRYHEAAASAPAAAGSSAELPGPQGGPRMRIAHVPNVELYARDRQILANAVRPQAEQAQAGPSNAAPNGARNVALNGARNGAPNGARNGAPNGARNGAPYGARNGAPNGAHNAAPNGGPNGARNAAPNGGPNGARNAAPNGAPNAAPVVAHNAAPNVAHNAAPNVAHNAAPNGVHNAAPNGAHNAAPNGAHNAAPNGAPNAAPNGVPNDAVVIRENLRVKPIPNCSVPLFKRQSFIKVIYDSYCKIYDSETAKNKAVDAEEEIARNANGGNYRTKMAHKSLSIRREGAVLAGEIPVERNPIEDPLNPSYTYGTPLYDCFVNFVVKDLYEQGIPVEHPTDPGCARMKILFNEGARSYGKSYNICLNCGQKFSVDENNFSIERKCTYHNDRRQSSKTLGSKYRERVWACCGQNKPCIVSEYHVRDVVNYERMPGFVKAPPCKDENKFPGIYAIDCEMCHTTEDHELTRVTVINHERKVVYESFCKPLNPIIDYCTRFSGVAEKDLENVNTTLADIHRDLFKFVNEKTILVGHGLGSDMKALKLLHKNIVDTSCIFLQRRSGFKQKLRDLAQEYLKRSIQEGVNGHCSEEDALAALDLMFHRIKEVCKANKPRTIISLDMVR